MNFLVPSCGGVVDKLFMRENSPPSNDDNLSSSSSSQASNTDQNFWMEEENSRRIVKMIDNKIARMDFEDGLLTCNDWEEIININEASIYKRSLSPASS